MIAGAMIGGAMTGEAVAGGTVTGFVIHALVVSLLLGCAATLAEPLARAARLPARWVWLGAMLLSVGLVAGGVVGGSPMELGEGGTPSGSGDPALVDRTAPHPGQDLARGTGWPGLIASAFSRPGGGLSHLLGEASHLLPVPSPSVVAGLALLWLVASTALLALLMAATHRHARLRRGWPRVRVFGVEARLSPGGGPGHGPAVGGLFRPEVILPRWALALPAEDLRLVLRHESEHRRARDPALLLLASLCVAAVPWNVPLWWQLRRLRDAVEMDCDARVLRSERRRRPYAELLLRVAAAADRARAPAGRTSPCLAFPTLASLSLGGPSSQLERRFFAMRPVAPRPLRLTTAAAAALLLVLAACLADQPLPVEPEAAEPTSAVDPSPAVHLEVPLDIAEVPPADGVVGDIDGARAFQEVRLEATRSAAAGAGRIGTRIRVRTGGSLGGLAASDAEDSPLVVVNGEALTLSGSEVELNPEDIASIEVLKGAAAQARYGARAANGVILITLKDGA